MKRVWSQINQPRIVLVLFLMSSVMVACSISFRIFLKTYLPFELGAYNTSLYTIILNLMSIVLIIWFIALLNIRATFKGLMMPVVIVLYLFVTGGIGHFFISPAVKLFCNLNKDKLIELKALVEENNIQTIKRIPIDGDFYITPIQSGNHSNEHLTNVSEELGFVQLEKQDGIKLVYEFSLWGEYGLILTDEGTNNTAALDLGEHIAQWQEFNTHVYYYEFE